MYFQKISDFVTKFSIVAHTLNDCLELEGIDLI